VGVVVHDRAKVGVVSQKWVWSEFFARALRALYTLSRALFS
jgi:hypothetical protein